MTVSPPPGYTSPDLESALPQTDTPQTEESARTETATCDPASGFICGGIGLAMLGVVLILCACDLTHNFSPGTNSYNVAMIWIFALFVGGIGVCFILVGGAAIIAKGVCYCRRKSSEVVENQPV
ncbi:hypothetical protein N7490_004734 [Penicillium lividum]|nr:hypothetical protein N7490_004734 [Penicillium lividum]